MTIVEVFLFFAAAFGVYRLLAPLQRRLEAFLFKVLRRKNGPPSPVIDITDYSKKDKSE